MDPSDNPQAHSSTTWPSRPELQALNMSYDMSYDDCLSPTSPPTRYGWATSPLSPTGPAGSSSNLNLDLQLLDISSYLQHTQDDSAYEVLPFEEMPALSPHSSQYFFGQNDLAYPTENIFSPTSAHSAVTDMLSLRSPSVNSHDYFGYPEIFIQGEETDTLAEIPVGVQLPGESNMSHSWAQAGISFMSTSPSPSCAREPDMGMSLLQLKDTAFGDASQPHLKNPGMFTAGELDTSQICEDPKKRHGSQDKLGSFMRGYQDFVGGSPFLRKAEQVFKQKVSTKNGLKASAVRRKTIAKFACDYCEGSFTRKHNLENHCKSHFGIKDLPCCFCLKPFTTLPSQKRHQESCHSNPQRKTATHPGSQS